MPARKRSPDSSTFLLARVTAGDLMTRNVLCVRPQLSLDALCLLFLESGLKAVPVVDGDGHVLGMVSELDVQLEVHTGAADGSRTVADAMSYRALTIPEHAPIRDAAGLLALHSLERVPVVASDGSVVGVLANSDILSWLAESDAAWNVSR